MATPAIMSQLRRRFISSQIPNHGNSITQASSWHSSIGTMLDRYGLHKKGFFSTDTNPDKHVCEDADSSKPSVIPDNAPTSMSTNENSESGVKFSANSSLKTSSRHDLAMIFTCKVCETRSIKTVCRESYEKGVVVARCGGCNNHHLIADHLGWFGEPRSIEDFLAARGEDVKKGSIDTLNLTLEDIAGKQPALG
ncbi:uncharacterized protein LOC130720173 [Lotus japonicus]|uniref:DNL-type domain-containing protein n=1 Tax=Lotus japonicus TaxID=34305 RepID=I3SDC8_LOTJA|nr:uncharacterized protein LOC130720144 [Lotus japonicus]XP_057426757.1 uncharacterized protein LOC130720159 [Lotus japonicus]XP_057426777.1 uncharacterized protein LOC130720173 [Lotus japonicus]AFK38270.1 unknown [Lotus japonicus]